MSKVPLVGGDVDIGENTVVRVDEIHARITWFKADRDDLLAFLR